MLFQQLTFILEFIFFTVLLIYVFFVWRERGCHSLKEKLYLVLPAAVAIILSVSGIYGQAAGCVNPAADILSSLLLMLLWTTYSTCGYRYLSVLSYLSVLVSAMLVVLRLSGLCNRIPAAVIFYPMILALIVTVMVLLSRKACSEAVTGSSRRALDGEDLFFLLFSISAFFFILLLSVSGSFIPYGKTGSIVSFVSVILALGLYFLHFNRNVRSFSKSGKRFSPSSVPPPPALNAGNKSGDNDAVKELYDRILYLFDTDKPYLIDNMTVSDVARMLFTNKVYVSRAINDYTGKNFCQFVNYYRIMYAVRLFEENPYLKVSDLSDMSGFHNQVSFNMAFRMLMNDTPSDWCKRRRLEREG